MNTEINTKIATVSMQDLLQRNVQQYPSHGIWLMRTNPPLFLSYPVLWQQGRQYAHYLYQQGINSNSVIVMPMQPTAEVLIAIVAIFQLGCRLVPVSHRRRAKIDSPAQAAFINVLRTCDTTAVIVEATELDYYKNQIAAFPCTVLPTTRLGETKEDNAIFSDFLVMHSFSLVQFSSGSLASPKGVVLTEENIVSNIAAIAERIGAVPHDICYSWLPLYHDMGLIGALFTTFYAGATICLDTPISFTADPLSWLKKIADTHATTTVAPQFAYNLCSKLGQLNDEKLADIDLSRLRLAMNGAENIHYESCRLFERLFAKNGLRPNTIQPCYGMSENCVAVTIRKPGSPLCMLHLSRKALAEGRIIMMPEPSKETITVLSNGTPLRGTTVIISNEHGSPLKENQPGEIRINGRSATRSILVAGTVPETIVYPPDTWVPTGDIGFFNDGELYIVGRVKEIFKKGGRTYIPNDIEMTLIGIKELAPNHVVAISVYLHEKGQEELVIIAELFKAKEDLVQLEENIRRVLLSCFQLTPLEVLFVRAGRLAKTSSGKLRRLLIRSMYEKKELKYLAD